MSNPTPLPTTGHQSAEIIIVGQNCSVFLQHRDDKPGIANPGCFTSFGGTVEPGEDLLEAAVRELNEETNLKLTAADLHYWRSLEVPAHLHGFASTAHYFLTPPLDIKNFEFYEGQGYTTVSNLADIEHLKMSVTARKAFTAYFTEAPTFASLG